LRLVAGGMPSVDARVADAALNAARKSTRARARHAMDRRYLAVHCRELRRRAGGRAETLAAALAEQRDVDRGRDRALSDPAGPPPCARRAAACSSEGGYRHIGLAMPKGQKQQLDLLAAGNPPEDA
jgi:Holliday junction DNA helicase RuvB